MRSSKSRSRSKSNRNNNRSVGNIVNRVFDSSGPDGKVRGTPQQIIDKYLTLARDAQLSNDRVAAENFLQHAEHYARMLGEAQREQQKEAEARREREEAQRRERNEQREAAQQNQNGSDQGAPNGQDRSDPPAPEPAPSDTPLEVADADPGAESGLVETPESKPKPRSRRRKPDPAPAAEPPTSDAQEAAE